MKNMLNIINHEGNANQNHNEIFAHPPDGYYTPQKGSEYGGGGTEKLKPSPTASGNVKWFGHLGK